MNQTIALGDLRFELRLSPRRRTIEICVERNGSLVVRAPTRASTAKVEAFVRSKRLWVYKKLAEKEAMLRSVPVREYVTGEGFPYLGRSYRLLLVEAQDEPLKLEAGRFRLLRTQVSRGREQFIRWYIEHGETWIRKRLAIYAERIGVQPRSVVVRELGYRWGSCGTTDVLSFNWAIILLPPSIVEYVIVHELVHLKERNHSPKFWKGVERAMPDYETRRAWLKENGARVAGV